MCLIQERCFTHYVKNVQAKEAIICLEQPWVDGKNSLKVLLTNSVDYHRQKVAH